MAHLGADMSHQCDIVPGFAAGSASFDELESVIESNEVDELGVSGL
jgi:hypothetical protein